MHFTYLLNQPVSASGIGKLGKFGEEKRIKDHMDGPNESPLKFFKM